MIAIDKSPPPAVSPLIADSAAIEELTEVELDKFNVTYSLTGGYIKKIIIKPYGEELNFYDIGFMPEHKGILFTLRQESENRVVLESREAKVKKEWEFNQYHIAVKIDLGQESGPVVLFSNPLSDNGLEQRYQEVFYQKSKSSLISRKAQRGVKDLEEDGLALVGARDRYFCIAFYNHDFPGTFKRDKNVVIASSIANNGGIYNFYLGPQTINQLKEYGLEKIVYYGFFHSIGLTIIKTLYFFKKLTNSWGISVLLLSFLIYFILFPFTAQSTKAMKRMQEIQPEIQELQKKYKDNPQKMQKEQLELFRKHKVNPLGGCLPMFLQFPVFIALYQALFRFVALKGASFLWIKDLSLPDRTIALPFSLPYFGNFINILPLIILAINYFKQKITTQTGNQQQQSTQKIFVLLIGIIFYHFPSCLVLYWLVQNSLTFLYQYKISRPSIAVR
ncbi:MAG: membrane protein insertase YidC [Candidatus Omnitrophota bacterium]